MKIQEYLKRLSVPEEKKLDLRYLTKLQQSHMEKIPFENLDVTRNVPIKLDHNSFYEKILIRNRGGFCYELNGLFQLLLSELGFQAHLISCTVKKPDGWVREDSHAAILVSVDHFPYLVDVGFGDSVRQPMPLTGIEKTDVSGTYRVKEIGNETYDLEKLEYGQWKILYRFSEKPKQLHHFTDACLFNQTSPESHFTHDDLATIATKNGRVTLSGLTVTKSENGSKEKMELNEKEKSDFLLEQFQIKI
ncbi:arylamine N-acetyltransferase [Bacillus sp. ISL-47]|uniref:arylamine N-acetyltransferase family protein n=1 Tax=Bacillus sp. ISL-47 TaxID=2819130 RepID=UPI001BE8199A|nr:arylamine N-acetyltransferase [Bacillus sp. ISL-47]MBT2689632.1 arylamine N-acetyltransferase [Bacillus sp. ISL-47]MBT2708451.1 arylamine N-acetyltransferase [Pseudomonas sp. ISL-84]